MKDETGAGSVLCVALVAAVVVLTIIMIPLLSLFSLKHQTQATAEAAALAAADAASGSIGGYPCDLAHDAARLGGAELVSCKIDNLIATVAVSRTIVGVPVKVQARAGPPA